MFNLAEKAYIGQSDKMQWFIDAYKRRTLHDVISKTTGGHTISDSGKYYGTVCMPTGTGKSGVMYEDIIYNIDTFHGNKIIINVSSPILKLAQQLTSDLLNVMYGIYGDLDFVEFLINSSDEGRNYDADIYGLDTSKFEIGFDSFMHSANKHVAIVASCHKSLYKFVNVVSKYGLSKNAECITYIDEAHMIDIWPDTEEDDDITYVDLPKLKKFCKKVYMFSATPDHEVTCELDDDLSYNTDPTPNELYIINKHPSEAIEANEILPPLVSFESLYGTDLNAKVLINILHESQCAVPGIHHKILVTLRSSKELKALRIELERQGYMVFSTCAKFGFGTHMVTGTSYEDEYEDVLEFINAVDDYDDDCFVLHIRQLIQGIDIKSLTDCVISTNGLRSRERYRHMIQTVGRVLRPMKGERGIDIDSRKKKVGRVYFITNTDDSQVETCLRNFLIRYYGPDSVIFEEKRLNLTESNKAKNMLSASTFELRFGSETYEMEKLIRLIESYVFDNISVLKHFYKYNYRSNKDDLACKVYEVCDQYLFNGIGKNERMLIDKKPFIRLTKNIMKRHKIFS